MNNNEEMVRDAEAAMCSLSLREKNKRFTENKEQTTLLLLEMHFPLNRIGDTMGCPGGFRILQGLRERCIDFYRAMGRMDRRYKLLRKNGIIPALHLWK